MTRDPSRTTRCGAKLGEIRSLRLRCRHRQQFPHRCNRSSRPDASRASSQPIVRRSHHEVNPILLRQHQGKESPVLTVLGEELPHRKVPLTVPAGRAELRVEPIRLTASMLVGLKGKPAPELEGVVGWKGMPVRMADLRGKVVLLDFWGYWCGPCVAKMPVLIGLHERFADKGLAVVGVHLDVDGEVDTTAKLDERLTGIRRDLWKGKDLPFPVALVRGKDVTSPSGDIYRARAAELYGVLGYPTTIVIDREGRVVGALEVGELNEAALEVEKLLGAGTPAE